MLTKLQSAIASEDSQAIQDAVYELGKRRNSEGHIDDELAFEVIASYNDQKCGTLPLAGTC